MMQIFLSSVMVVHMSCCLSYQNTTGNLVVAGRSVSGVACAYELLGDGPNVRVVSPCV